MTIAYPLAWPQGWPRTPATRRRPASFTTQRGVRSPGPDGLYQRKPGPLTVAVARERLGAELERLGARGPVLSTNVELTTSGVPRSGRRDPQDVGAACYFQLDGRPLVLACDRWDTVAGNIGAIAAHIDAIRRMDRYGVGRLEQLFAGFGALPAPDRVDWRASLGIKIGDPVTRDLIEQRWRHLAAQHHPDRGGSHDQMARVNAARDAALQEIGP